MNLYHFYIIFYISLSLNNCYAVQKWEAIEASTEAKVQEKEVYALLDRIQDNLSLKFEIIIKSDKQNMPLNKDFVFVTKQPSIGALVRVEANTGVSASWGIHHYLKYYCGCHISWDIKRISKYTVYKLTKRSEIGCIK